MRHQPFLLSARWKAAEASRHASSVMLDVEDAAHAQLVPRITFALHGVLLAQEIIVKALKMKKFVSFINGILLSATFRSGSPPAMTIFLPRRENCCCSLADHWRCEIESASTGKPASEWPNC